MYKRIKPRKTSLFANNSSEGMTMEQQVELIMSNKEPIPNAKDLTYTEKKDGVRPDTDIRTDRFELACEVHDKVEKVKIANREHKAKMEIVKNDENINDIPNKDINQKSK